MKLLIIPSWYPPDGGGFFINQTNWLKDAGIETNLIYVEQKSLKKLFHFKFNNLFRIIKEDESGFPVLRLVTYKLPKLYRLNSFIWRELTYYLAKKYLKNNPIPDLIQVHSCMWGAAVAFRLKTHFNIPYVITEHRGRFNENNFTINTDIKKWFFKILKQPLLKADAIIPVSHLQIKYLEEIAGAKLKCFPIPNPVDETIFKPGNTIIKHGESTIFYTITNFLPYKAPEILIHSFYKASLIEDKIQLKIIGDGPDKIKMEELSSKLGIEKKVHFLGRIANTRVGEIINQSDFLVLSSLNEGQPVVVGESMLCGKPVIGTSVISEVDVPAFAGYIVSAGNSDELTNALLKAHQEKSKFNALEIREFSLKRFAKSAVIPSIINIFNTALTQK